MTTEYERRRDKYDTVVFRVKKGKADEYRQVAQDLGLGFWDFLRNGVEEYITNCTGKEASTSLSATEKTLVEEFRQLPADVQKQVVKLIGSINKSE